MLKLITALTLSAVAGYAATVALTGDEFPEYVIRATDSAGNVYIAGRGDDCIAAWEGAHLPPDWRDIICIQVSH